MRFRILGPMEVFDGRRWCPVPAAKARAVLATLLIETDRVVSVDRLVESVWGDDAPKTVANQVHGYVARLRKMLGDEGDLLVTRAPGYQFAAPQEVDAHRFRQLVVRGLDRLRTGDAAGASAELSAALELWRGRALADAPATTTITAFADGLEEERLAALEARIDADLECGRHAVLVPQLQSLTCEHPLRERLWRQYLLALYRCDRQAEALAAYRRLRHLLREELGIEPSAEVNRLHEQMLGRHPSVVQAAVSPVPHQLPRESAGFVGRARELKLLDSVCEGSAGGVPIALVTGMPGVGKTALALHWAHRAAASFPDGQLFADLHGYSSTHPVTAADVLGRFLRALGVAAPAVPHELDEKVALYRSTLAGRRMLVLLDNAADATEIRHVLPATAGCMVLVTSRERHVGLIARDGAVAVALEVLQPTEALALLEEALGPERVARHGPQTVALARVCAHLPLALRVAAANLAVHPGRDLTDYVHELTEGDRLAGLRVEADAQAAVGAAFDLSYHRLPAPARRLFRLLGLHPGPGFGFASAAALFGDDCPPVDTLTTAHLLQTDGDRYRMHDLLHEFAAGCAEREESRVEREAARDRLLNHYLSHIEAAAHILFGEPATRDGAFRDADTAGRWLETELANILAAIRVSPSHAIRASTVLYRHLDHRSLFAEGEAVHTQALREARRIGDALEEANALNRLSVVAYRTGRREQAREHLRLALARWQEAGDPAGQVKFHINLAMVETYSGSLNDAATHLEQALRLQRSSGDHARCIHNLGVVRQMQGRGEDAVRLGEQALALYQEVGNETGVAMSHGALGDAYELIGDSHRALDHLETALRLYRRGASTRGVADTLNGLGNAHRRIGEHDRAVEHHRRAIDLHLRSGHRDDEAKARNDLGITLAASGQPAAAAREHEQALAVARAAGNGYEESRAIQLLAAAMSPGGGRTP